MSVARRLFHVVRSQVQGARARLPLLDQFGQRVSERVAETWRETRRAYEQGRQGDPETADEPADDPANGGRRAGGRRSGARPSRGRRDPRLAAWYANLEVPYGSDLDTVTRAWKRLVRLYHPDRHHADPERREHATELIKGINHAYEQLRRRLEPSRARR